MKKAILFLALLVSSTTAFAQTGTQTIKGTIVDAQSKYPLIGANVIVVGSQPLIGGSTDADGAFKLTSVPLGRQTLKVSYLGYRERTLPNVLVTSGKEVVLTVDLEEQIVTADEVVVTAERDKSEVNNELAVVSARSFDVEQTARYAGSRNDPARMAANFAGVSGANDARNDIVIRGNSPTGLLWRLEGINIPNPNHYGGLGATGGPVSMLNNNVLDRSDFMTAAFPAQYGNALAGVFDLQMRSGNHEKREYLGQVGFNGFELGAEGPFSKNSKASYLINYRYSTLGALQAIGLEFGTGSATPQYQDLSFKIDIPTAKAGRFSIFGVGGASNIEFLGNDVDTTSSSDLFGEENSDSNSDYQTGVVGISHTYYFNPTTFSKLSLAASTSRISFQEDSLSLTDRTPTRRENAEYTQNKYSFVASLNKKFNARNNASIGYTGDLYDFNLLNQKLAGQEFQTLRDNQGTSLLSQAFAQWQHRFNDQLTFNTGVNFLHFSLNNRTAIEPRAGLRYQLSPTQSVNVGYGYHSQIQPLLAYFVETPTETGTVLTNEELDYTRSQHFAIGYDQSLTSDLRVKVEAYYQYLTNVPVQQRASSYSILNTGADFDSPDEDSLVNNGTGRNYGVELTVEKFYNQGYYFLVTASLFDSRYRGSDDVLRNTAFNGRYVFNVLAGKEFKVGKKNNVFALDWKLTSAGGKYVTPIDFTQSKQTGSEVYRTDAAFSTQVKDYFRTDVKVSYRMNRKKVTHEFSLDLQNVTNSQNVFQQRYNPRTNQLANEYQIGLFPVPQYRILF